MTLPKNGTVKRIFCYIAGALLMAMAGAVASNTIKVATHAVKIDAIVGSQAKVETTLETIRKENNGDHERIDNKLDRIIAKESDK